MPYEKLYSSSVVTGAITGHSTILRFLKPAADDYFDVLRWMIGKNLTNKQLLEPATYAKCRAIGYALFPCLKPPVGGETRDTITILDQMIEAHGPVVSVINVALVPKR